MNLSLDGISTLVKSNIGEKCPVNILMDLSTVALRNYLKLANIYRANSSKKKTGLVEMMVYECITNKLNKKEIEDISVKEAHKILKEKEIILKSLPGYGNAELKKKDMKPYESGGLSIMVEK